jgi:hypothetical protein
VTIQNWKNLHTISNQNQIVKMDMDGDDYGMNQ